MSRELQKNNADFPLVSIIMAAYNADKFIAQAIQSVLDQTYTNWELLIVNDGSIDNTESEIRNFSDIRIRYFIQENKGVSAARNVGLSNMEGAFFCMLDADDVLPVNSIKSRMNLFNQHDGLEFADGTVILKDATLENEIRRKHFNFFGNPLRSLVRLDGNCFFGPTWMIKIMPEKLYFFDENMTHGEELMLYLNISKDGIYAAVDEPVLIYRISANSAMSKLKGLEDGYKKMYLSVKKFQNVSASDKSYMKMRIIRIMFLSYLSRKEFGNAFKAVFRFLFL
jgi:teichuronic acid biosynthesis glycosyltransferase TuaG